MEWFKRWFNSDDYLEVYRHRDEQEAAELVQLILNNIDREKVRDILDMAAGFGRHAVILAKEGFNVTAVDLSENLLSIAKKNAKKQNVDIEFAQSDIRYFTRDQKFDLVLNLFTSIGYFEKEDENFSVLNKAYDLLKPEGCFILDYFNKKFIEKNLVPSNVDDVNGKTIIQNRFIEGNRIVKEIIINRDGNSNKFVESVRMYSKHELFDALNTIGFRITKIFGDFSGNSFELESSPRIIIIACK